MTQPLSELCFDVDINFVCTLTNVTTSAVKCASVRSYVAGGVGWHPGPPQHSVLLARTHSCRWLSAVCCAEDLHEYAVCTLTFVSCQFAKEENGEHFCDQCQRVAASQPGGTGQNA